MKNVMIGDVLNKELQMPMGRYCIDPIYITTVIELAMALFTRDL